MQLPVDIKALLGEMTDVKEARETPVSVSVYVDESAPAELVAHVRNVFASSSPHVRMTVSYLSNSFAPHPLDDVAIVVSDQGAVAGKSAAAIRSVGVPVMVVTLVPGKVAREAEASGEPIPEGDLVSPASSTPSDAEAAVIQKNAGLLDEHVAEALDERMGRWIVSVCRAKRLAFAIAFPFMRRPLAKDSVQLTALENAGVGLIPFVAGADLPIMTLNQAKMALQIAAAYGQDMDKNRLKELGVVVGGAYVSRSLARKLIAAVPVLGFAFKTGIAYGSTMAVGYAIIEYFEGGEDVTGVANVVERAASSGGKIASFVQEKASAYVPGLIEAVGGNASAK